MARSADSLVRCLGAGFVVSVFVFGLPGLRAQGFTSPPTRKACVGGTMPNSVCLADADCPGGGSCKALECNDTCPPGRCTRDAQNKITAFTKIDPDPRLTNVAAQKDQDKNGDGRVDYFLGEWKFVEGNKDVIVRKWCLNGGPPNGAFHDAFSFEIATSLNGTETQQVKPSNETLT